MAKGEHGFFTQISSKQNSKAPENTDTIYFGNQNRSRNFNTAPYIHNIFVHENEKRNVMNEATLNCIF